MSDTDAIFSVEECDVTRRTTPRLRQQWACLIERMSVNVADRKRTQDLVPVQTYFPHFTVVC